MKVYIKNQQKLIKVTQRRIAGLLRKALQQLNLPKAELSILFVGDRRMRILNRQYRGMDKTTDVLSFPMLSPEELKRGKPGVSCPEKSPASHIRASAPSLPLGDIVISLQRAKRQAEEQGVSLNEELTRLLIHGLLHLMGYDHEQSLYLKRKMEKKEIELLMRLSDRGHGPIHRATSPAIPASRRPVGYFKKMAAGK
jgi:probable rRNA maturation factor